MSKLVTRSMDHMTINETDAEIMSIHLNNTQTSMYDAKIGNTNATALFDSGATLSCISERFYAKIRHLEPNRVIDMNAGPPLLITSASEDELINLGRCRLRFKLGQKSFEYYFQIIKNLKRDLILGLNFQKMFKISQDITDDNDLYLHIRNNIVTFSIQPKNVNNYIKTQECMEIHGRQWKQFHVKAPKGLKGSQVYEIDFNAKGLPKNVIPVLDTFIA